MQLLYANQAALKLGVWFCVVEWISSLSLNYCQCLFCAEVSLLHGPGGAVSQILMGFSPASSLPCSGIGDFLLQPSLDCWIPQPPQQLGLGPSPAPAWVVSKPWEWLGTDGAMQCSFRMDQINCETISSISRHCSSLNKASVFYPKSRDF